MTRLGLLSLILKSLMAKAPVGACIRLLHSNGCCWCFRWIALVLVVILRCVESVALNKCWAGSNGEDICEGHGFNPSQCQAVGCCHWDDGQVELCCCCCCCFSIVSVVVILVVLFLVIVVDGCCWWLSVGWWTSGFVKMLVEKFSHLFIWSAGHQSDTGHVDLDARCRTFPFLDDWWRMGTNKWVLIAGGWQGTSSTMEMVFSECLPRPGGNSLFGVFRMTCATSINIPTEWLSRQDGDWTLFFFRLVVLLNK